MTEKENALITIRHGQPEWVPCFYDAYQPMGASLLNNQGEYGKGGIDMFGVNWLVTRDTGYQAIPDPSQHVLDDVTQWRDIVHFPDLDAMDWEAAAARDLANVDREEKLLCLFGMEGNFNRLQSLMGICEAMIAMVEEPEEVAAFFQAHTDFKCKTIEKIAEYYQPDIYVNGDDVCSSDGLFISRTMYDDLIKPYEIQLGQKAKSLGLIVEHHVCGKCENIIPDIIETGATIWQTAQSINDLVKIKEQYGDRLLIHGGWDSYGPQNFDGCTEEQVRAEVRRCIDTYAKGGNYALFPIVMGDMEDPKIQQRRGWVSDECKKYSLEFYKKHA
ncbi:MAG TPA: hypothetical protein GXX75_12795 [Clostridiales bacterium]|nr:hypothetical protein [Clostridiales bacterium]